MTDSPLIGLSGSLRADSYNAMLFHEAARRFGAPDAPLANLRLPLFDEDIEKTTGIPDEVEALAHSIAAAKAVVIASPEYNQSLSGVLKNALDWISRTKVRPWRDKPVAIVAAAAGRTGGARGVYSLRLAMMPFRANVLPGPEVLVAAPGQAFDSNGHLTNERYGAALDELMGDLRVAAGLPPLRIAEAS